MHKALLIKHLHKLYRTDPWVNEMFNSAGITLDNLEDTIEDLKKQFWFDTMTDFGIQILEKALSFKVAPNSSLEDKRSQLEARWKSSGKSDLALLQSVANSWKNGDIQVQFVNGNIQIKFVGELGVPQDLDNLKKALEDIKPAQLLLVYLFRYYLIQEINGVMTLDKLQQQPLSKFAF
ncbi:putative phage tail protein [Clostridium tyrobutyricum]|uniref:putative phage tail protein n=1 Tax=Clostridium tyrobutyricum TaxID=1519 RepID=UPI001C395867|nr:putative phage tail protein [Clostridium tyrobutyricum]MBV4417077.1 DUF2313 domain-containing protein [Clostridium tyrobutyricum]